MNSFSLEGKVALVTGAGQGIGRGVALGFAQAGADVACIDVRMDGVEETAHEIERLGRKATALTADVTDLDAMVASVERVESALGPLDVAFNNAGIAIGDVPTEELSQDAWRKVIDVNLTGVFLCAQAEARVMLPRRSGAILSMASMSGSIVNRGLLQTNYNVSKAGVVHLTKCLAVEWADRGVRVNSLSPGYVMTPMTARPEVKEKREAWIREIPLGRLAEIDDLVGPAVFAVSDGSRYMTGHDLVIDGGFVCW